MKKNCFPPFMILASIMLIIIVSGLFACGPAEIRAAEARHADVVIVGGGLSGLITAYELQNLGITSHILEANDVLGGRVATADYRNGLHAEFGLHELWEEDPISDYVKKFNIPVTKSGEAYSSVIMDGKLYPFIQDTYKEYAATLFSPEERKEFTRWQKECGIIYDEADSKGLTPKCVSLQAMSFGKWVNSMKLPPRVMEFIRLGMECEFAADWDSVSALYGILQCRMFLKDSEPSFHAKRGNQALINALAQAIKEPKTLGARVTRIVRARKPDGTTECAVYYMKNNVMEVLKCKKIVVAIPYQLLHAIQFEPSLTDDQWKAVDTLTAGLYTVVHFIIDTKANKILFVNGKNPFPILTRGPLGVIYGFLEAPPASKKEEIFSLLIFGENARTYLEPQDKLRARYLAELDKLWPGFSKFVHETYIYGYHPVATPCWPPGRSPLDALSISLRKENVGMYLAGDFVYSSHAEGTVLSGREAAKKIARDLKKK